MKIWKLGIFVILIAMVAFGCAKNKQEVAGLAGLYLEGEDKDVVTQVITSPEVVESAPAATQPQPAPVEVQPQPAPVKEGVASTTLPSDELERNKLIQTALKNANLYFGEIDGKIGPMARKAIEEFQKMKGLKVDGKVGPITWGELRKSLTKTKK